MTLRKFSSNKGFSLVEIMVALAVLGIITLGSSTLFINLSKNMKRIELKQNEISVLQEIKAIISDKNSCQTSLIANQAFNLTTASIEITSFLNASATNGLPFRLKLIANSGTLGAGQNLDIYDLQTEFFNITDAETVGPATAAGQLYRTRLWARFKPINGKDLNFRPKPVGGFYIKVLANRITECFSISEENETEFNELFKQLCLGLGGTVVSSTCELNPIFAAKGKCPSGQYASGFDSNGSIVCNTVPVPPQPTASPCTGSTPSCSSTCGWGEMKTGGGYVVCSSSGWRCVPVVCVDNTK